MSDPNDPITLKVTPFQLGLLLGLAEQRRMEAESEDRIDKGLYEALCQRLRAEAVKLYQGDWP